MRDLIEFSRYGPTSAKYKIFIIDEVHMLSKQAFNALLKTLRGTTRILKIYFCYNRNKKNTNNSCSLDVKDLIFQE